MKFYTVDVFTEHAFSGAQIAVISDAASLSQEVMLDIAQEFNLSETVFIVKQAEGSYRLRIFSPFAEVDFGSHTLVAAAHVLASIGDIALPQKQNEVYFTLNKRRIAVTISQEDNKPTFIQFSMTTMPVVDAFVPLPSALANILSLEERTLDSTHYQPMLISDHGLYLVVPVYQLDDVRRADFDKKSWNFSEAPSTLAQRILLFSPQAESNAADFRVRLLGPSIAHNDDPPIGAAIPAFSAYLREQGLCEKGVYSFAVERGDRSQRQSIIHVEIEGKKGEALRVSVGGSGVMMSEGVIKKVEQTAKTF